MTGVTFGEGDGRKETYDINEISKYSWIKLGQYGSLVSENAYDSIMEITNNFFLSKNEREKIFTDILDVKPR